MPVHYEAFQRPAVSRTHETTGERIKRLTDTRPRYPRSQKLPAGSTLELNTADTTDLQKIPGIGPAFSKRIVIPPLEGFWWQDGMRGVGEWFAFLTMSCFL